MKTEGNEAYECHVMLNCEFWNICMQNNIVFVLKNLFSVNVI